MDEEKISVIDIIYYFNSSLAHALHVFIHICMHVEIYNIYNIIFTI